MQQLQSQPNCWPSCHTRDPLDTTHTNSKLFCYIDIGCNSIFLADCCRLDKSLTSEANALRGGGEGVWGIRYASVSIVEIVGEVAHGIRFHGCANDNCKGMGAVKYIAKAERRDDS